MTTMQEIMAELSDEATSALINAGNSAIGTRVLSPSCPPAAFVELAEWGLIGPNDGLTAMGSRARKVIMDAALEAAFG
jgi:hypothetical protein